VSNNFKIYLAGPINACTDSEAKGWRQIAAEHLTKVCNFQIIDPMSRDYRGKEHCDYKEIVEQDKLDIQNADYILAYCPKPSVGTSMEIFYASSVLNKPVIVIAPAPMSPWIIYHAEVLCTNLEDALKWFNCLANEER
jgi:nucleoside 2-deoxyribosyltransferase